MLYKNKVISIGDLFLYWITFDFLRQEFIFFSFWFFISFDFFYFIEILFFSDKIIENPHYLLAEEENEIKELSEINNEEYPVDANNISNISNF